MPEQLSTTPGDLSLEGVSPIIDPNVPGGSVPVVDDHNAQPLFGNPDLQQAVLPEVNRGTLDANTRNEALNQDALAYLKRQKRNHRDESTTEVNDNVTQPSVENDKYTIISTPEPTSKDSSSVIHNSQSPLLGRKVSRKELKYAQDLLAKAENFNSDDNKLGTDGLPIENDVYKWATGQRRGDLYDAVRVVAKAERAVAIRKEHKERIIKLGRSALQSTLRFIKGPATPDYYDYDDPTTVFDDMLGVVPTKKRR